MNPTTQPPQPAATVLRQTRTGRLPAYVDRATGSRFTVERNESVRVGGERGRVVVPFEDSGYTVRDTKGANILGHGHRNSVIVYELDDARAMIDRVLRAEWLYTLQKWIDAERVRQGLPTIAEEAARKTRDAKTALSRSVSA